MTLAKRLSDIPEAVAFVKQHPEYNERWSLWCYATGRSVDNSDGAAYIGWMADIVTSYRKQYKLDRFGAISSDAGLTGWILFHLMQSHAA